jgi:dTDP-4-amino-4,6-dideoxygalactose transaminase
MIRGLAEREARSEAGADVWPFYADDELEAVAEVLRSGRVNQWTGPYVDEFTTSFAARMGGNYGIALANGTLALELPLRVWGIGAGDEVIVSPRSFVASAACASFVGATPVFADVDRDSGNITAASIAARITARTRAVIVVHLAGWPADMPAIMALADRHGVKVIEDCAQAHGATIDGRPVGSFGTAAAFSFCQDKIMTTGGEGGFAMFREQADYDRAWSFKDHGKSRAAIAAPPTRPGFRFLHESIGTNWRMTSVQAVLGSIQLGKLDRWIAARRRNAAIWREALQPVGVLRMPEPEVKLGHARYKMYVYGQPERLRPGCDRDTILAELATAGLRAFSGSCSEIYREKAFAGLKVKPCSVSAELGRTSLMFEVHPTLEPAILAERAARAAAIIAAHAA